jgi:hypothetical protein
MRNFGFMTLLILTLVAGAFAQAPQYSTAPGADHQSDNDRDDDRNKREDDDDGDHEDRLPVRSGYAVISSASTGGLVAFGTFGFKRGFETVQAGVLPSDLTTDAVLFVNSSGRLSRNLGVAIVNPATTNVNVTLELAVEDGSVVASKTISVNAGHQTARLVTELFSDRPQVPKDMTGTVRITSTGPVALIGLRFRGLNFSTIPVTSLSGEAPSTAGPGSPIVLAHFATGGGWATEIVIVNSSNTPATVRVDLFKTDGTPLTANLNGQSKTSFTDLTIPARGVLTLSPRGKDGFSRF